MLHRACWEKRIPRPPPPAEEEDEYLDEREDPDSPEFVPEDDLGLGLPSD